MADIINVNDLPFLLLGDFSDGDSFLIVDNGKLKRITRASLYSDVVNNLRGQKGDTGATGAQGAKGEKGDKGDTGAQGATGAQGEQGIQGDKGDDGYAGWSPLIRVDTTSEGQFLYVYNWTGGQGLKPTSVGYITPTGLSSTPTLASSIRGSQGIQGIQGDRGANGANGESNYAIAVRNGYIGTEAAWLQTQIGKNNYQLAVQDGYTGTLTQWLNELTHKDSYALAVDNGFVGTLDDWILSLNGDDAWTPSYSVEVDGDGNYLIKITDWFGGSGIKPPINEYLIDTATGQPANFKGIKGDKAWYPTYALESTSTECYLKVIGWSGGEGVQPTETGYVSPTGLVATTDTAINVKGVQGIDGDKGYTPQITTEEDTTGIFLKVSSYINGTGDTPTELGYLSETGLVALKEDATNFSPKQSIINTTLISKNKINVITATEDVTVTSDLAVGESTDILINPATFTVTFDSIVLSDGFALTASKSHLIKVFNYDGTIKATILGTF